jgi:hypothetical protein
MLRFARPALLGLFLLGGLALPLLGDEKPSNKSKDQAKTSDIPIHLDHIFNGGVNRQGNLVGMHHLASAPKELKVEGKACKVEVVQTSPGGKNDVVTAKVILRDMVTNRIVLEKFSSLFPAAWSKADIEATIREAYADAKSRKGVDRDGRFTGHARGIRVDGYLTRDGDAIATAFPVYQGPKQGRKRQ